MTDVMPEQQGVDLDELVGDGPAGTDDLDAVDEQLIARLAGRARAGELQLTGEGGLLAQLTKRLVESALEGEITDHLGYDRHDAAGRDGGNSCNGHRTKTVLTEVGPVEVDVPRDRDATFEPKIVAKRQRRLSGVDELVISLSAKGLTTGEVQAHLTEVYGAEVSRQTISTITDKVIEGMGEWQNRPLDPVYPVIFIDAIHVKIRDGKVANRPVYVALAVTAEGHRDILGLWAGDASAGGEGAKYWLHVLTEIKNRGVNDVLMVVCDGLTGLPDAVTATWPATITQTSSVHHDRAGEVPVITCTVSGRTYADASPSRSRCRPVRPRRWRASHRSAGAAPTSRWSAEMRFRRGRPCRGDQACEEQRWSTSGRLRQRPRCSPASTGAVRSTRSV
jgi:putative transposase